MDNTVVDWKTDCDVHREGNGQRQAVKAGLGLSIMPLIGLKHEMEAGELKMLKIDGLPVHTEWQLISLKGKRHGPVAEAFRVFITEHKTTLAMNQFVWLKDF